ncbi:hypothetical protein JJE66_30930 [Bradyrhizobium diazoefficiens]|uniref:hypothetical protein n=1 Tax=Bradyrhizobium diazoefficiens TaxID=1355477 RepID=UPI00190C485E|nr:hypothetical protein [Bradyrhizobium diazoefficiens]MBK3665623.1 hypothetical protein [Bradyrhizobium diazoefficiens]
MTSAGSSLKMLSCIQITRAVTRESIRPALATTNDAGPQALPACDIVDHLMRKQVCAWMV